MRSNTSGGLVTRNVTEIVTRWIILNDLTALWSWTCGVNTVIRSLPNSNSKKQHCIFAGMRSLHQFFFLWSRGTFHSDNLHTGQGRQNWDFITASQIHPSPADHLHLSLLLLGLSTLPSTVSADAPSRTLLPSQPLSWTGSLTQRGFSSTILATFKHFPQITTSIISLSSHLYPICIPPLALSLTESLISLVFPRPSAPAFLSLLSARQ